VRTRGDAGDDVPLNQALLAYASDFSLLGTAMRPHGVNWMSGVQTASLDHILWFHRPTNFSRWHLYVQDSPSASGARGFNRGAIYRDDGVLVASAAQEGLIRHRS
jgi:acyl-CoA thioesterase-2